MPSHRQTTFTTNSASKWLQDRGVAVHPLRLRTACWRGTLTASRPMRESGKRAQWQITPADLLAYVYSKPSLRRAFRSRPGD